MDFLLGCAPDPATGELQDRVVEHQTTLRVAFGGARERLLAAAYRWKARHDQRVQDEPLPFGPAGVFVGIWSSQST